MLSIVLLVHEAVNTIAILILTIELIYAIFLLHLHDKQIGLTHFVLRAGGVRRCHFFLKQIRSVLR